MQIVCYVASAWFFFVFMLGIFGMYKVSVASHTDVWVTLIVAPALMFICLAIGISQ